MRLCFIAKLLLLYAFVSNLYEFIYRNFMGIEAINVCNVIYDMSMYVALPVASLGIFLSLRKTFFSV